MGKRGAGKRGAETILKRCLLLAVVIGLAGTLGAVFTSMFLAMPYHPANFIWLLGAYIPVFGLLAIGARFLNY